MTTRVLITDDHGVVRQGLRMFLSLDPDIQVVGGLMTAGRHWRWLASSSPTWS